MGKITNKVGSKFLRQVLRQMKRLGLNQSAMAKRLNVSRPYITRVMKGDVNITFETACKFANALQMDFVPELRQREEDPVAELAQPMPMMIANECTAR